ncbi:MAG: bifunctional UDP-N-acetylmuramoyl-tripeptide:D-alanyl-D-alanine ligase/alanine racemase [Dysgonamonadaceae bacterium]|jgi:alanine racemase|nr:bifunctional UDP-N-acetylmuramoyl-tripeptide:D-alanyl-D-alanine ligase/alanine racemase [Dysgonamonadaceae bacterium]
MQYKLSEISGILGCAYFGHDVVINHIFVDSRNRIDKLDTALFVAIKGERHDGHNYIEELYAKGIRNFIVNRDYPAENIVDGNIIAVENTLKAIQNIAANYRDTFSFPVLGITGSNGKTWVKEWIYQIFRNIKTVSRSPKSYNSQTGVPLSVLMADKASELGIFEAGISLPGEMERLEKILHPDVGIFTNIGDAHQENFTDIEQKIGEKLQLFKRSKLLIYCSDYCAIHQAISRSKHEYSTLNWGYGDECDLKILCKTNSRNKTIVKLRLNNSVLRNNTGNEAEFEIPFSDSASIENAMHCIAFALSERLDLNLLNANIANISPVAMRLELKEGANKCTIINDSYNSDVNSLTIALNFLDGLTQHRKKTLILSDIMQSESDEKKLYLQVSNLLQSRGISRFIGIGEALERNSGYFIANSNIPDCRFYRDTDKFLLHCNKANFNNEAILLKGGRQFRFERISRLLEIQVHQTVLEINMNAIVNNLNYFKSKLNDGVKLMAMVKASSYGHGSAEIAALLQYHRVDYLAVAYADEGVNLREAGITMPIVVLNTEPDNFDIMIEYLLEPEIYSLNSLITFLKTASGMGVSNYPVHIKVDTGMHRLGFVENDLPELCNILKNRREIKVASVFSHLAASDEQKHDDFTALQIDKFKRFCKALEKETGYSFIKHILNSSGIERFPEAQFDMARLGIGLYGVGIKENSKYLAAAGTLSSAIVQVKQIDEGETIGYGRHGVATTPKTIATVPIGYADGLNRKLGNGKGYFVVNGKPAPITGNICMDACMIDITGIDAKEGDRVIIMGEVPSVSEIANTIGTIPYEILTSISQRVKRIYISD